MTSQPEALSLIPETMAAVYKVLPLTYRDNILRVGIADPEAGSIADLKNFLGVAEVRTVRMSPQEIGHGISEAYNGIEETVQDLLRKLEEGQHG
jgi:type IV pilus assembly protein PilB